MKKKHTSITGVELGVIVDSAPIETPVGRNLYFEIGWLLLLKMSKITLIIIHMRQKMNNG